MPRGDGTGPMGMGSMTGRGAGFCAGFAAPGAGVFGCRRGAGGMMRGAGFQARNRFMAQSYAEASVPIANEKELLTNK